MHIGREGQDHLVVFEVTEWVLTDSQEVTWLEGPKSPVVSPPKFLGSVVSDVHALELLFPFLACDFVKERLLASQELGLLVASLILSENGRYRPKILDLSLPQSCEAELILNKWVDTPLG